MVDSVIGCHLSIKGSMMNIFKEAEDLKIKVIACFTGSNLRYNFNENFHDDVIVEFKKKLKQKDIWSMLMRVI